MNEIKAINKELKRLHKTFQLLLEHPDRVVGDVLHSDLYDNITKLNNTLINIARKNNGMEWE